MNLIVADGFDGVAQSRLDRHTPGLPVSIDVVGSLRIQRSVEPAEFDVILVGIGVMHLCRIWVIEPKISYCVLDMDVWRHTEHVMPSDEGLQGKFDGESR